MRMRVRFVHRRVRPCLWNGRSHVRKPVRPSEKLHDARKLGRLSRKREDHMGRVLALLYRRNRQRRPHHGHTGLRVVEDQLKQLKAREDCCRRRQEAEEVEEARRQTPQNEVRRQKTGRQAATVHTHARRARCHLRRMEKTDITKEGPKTRFHIEKRLRWRHGEHIAMLCLV